MDSHASRHIVQKHLADVPRDYHALSHISEYRSLWSDRHGFTTTLFSEDDVELKGKRVLWPQLIRHLHRIELMNVHERLMPNAEPFKELAVQEPNHQVASLLVELSTLHTGVFHLLDRMDPCIHGIWACPVHLVVRLDLHSVLTRSSF
jgi:hypothetical protein